MAKAGLDDYPLRPEERGEWPILWSKGPKDPPRRAVRTLWRATLTTTLVAVRAPRVLVAYDGTDKAEIALEAVASLGWPAGTCIRVVAVRDDHLRLLRPLVDEQPFVELEEALLWAANHLAADLPSNVAIERRLLRGAALPAIVAEAEELGADLVVLGSRNRGPMRSAIFGSVGRDLVARADRPVLIARGDRLDRVLLAHDGSDAARTAVRMLGSWPVFSRATVKLFSVAHTQPGSATGQILTAAALDETNLIVLGSAVAHGLDWRLHGDLADGLVPRTHCSLLVVPASARVELTLAEAARSG